MNKEREPSMDRIDDYHKKASDNKERMIRAALIVIGGTIVLLMGINIAFK